MNKLIVGFTELHGISKECMEYPPDGVKYVLVKSKKYFTDYIISSSAKGVFSFFEGNDVDIIEAPLFPVVTNKKWIYTPADIYTPLNFKLLKIPIPQPIKMVLINIFFSQKNLRKILFKSIEGKNSFLKYEKYFSKDVVEKVDVVYPAIRRVEDELISFNDNRVNFLFSGDFFRKGGAQVVDAFEVLQKKYNNISLRICSHESLGTGNKLLRNKYLYKIKNNPSILLGFVDRSEMINNILPNTDIFVSPTFAETFGFAILEAMAYGIPVISTNIFAIPELVEHGENGFLIDVSAHQFVQKAQNYIINDIPELFHHYLVSEIHKYMSILVDDCAMRRKFGLKSLEIARSKFSFEIRNKKMKKIYEDCLRDA